MEAVPGLRTDVIAFYGHNMAAAVPGITFLSKKV